MCENYSQNPKVLIVSTWFPSDGSPMSGIFVKRDVFALNSVASVKVIHLSQASEYDQIISEDIDGVEVIRIPLSLKNPFSLFKTGRLLHEYISETEILHTHAMSTLIPLLFTGVRIPWVHTEHWSGYVEWNTGFRAIMRWIVAQFAKQPTELVAVSSVLAKSLGYLTKRSVSVIPNIVEFSELRSRPIFNFDRPLKIVAVGNLIPRKRPILAAETCKVLNQRGIQTTLTWVGEGPLHEELKTYCERHNVDLNLPGILSTVEVSEAFANGDLSIFPTEAETFGLVGAEALAAGRPLVSGSNGGQCDFVEPPAGILVDSDLPEAYAEAILKVLYDTREMSSEQIAGPIRQRFSKEKLATQYQKIYCALLNNTHR